MSTYPPGRGRSGYDEMDFSQFADVSSGEPDKFIFFEISQIEKWADDNIKDARIDRLRYWAFKVPAMLSSASAGILAFYRWDVAAITIGAIGTLCILIDGVYPSGMLHKVHLMAAYDLRELQDDIVYKWRHFSTQKDQLTDEEKNVEMKKILDAIIEGKKRISDDLKKAEGWTGR